METQVHPGPVAPPLKPDSSVEPTLMMPGIGPIQARKLVIASVHFEPRSERFMHSRRQTFMIQPAPKGEVAYLTIYDSQQPIPTWASLDQQNPDMMPAPVPVETIASDCIKSWGWVQLNRQSNIRIGIDVIAGEQCTDAEKKRLIGLETTMCRAAVEEADRFHQSGKGEITAFHRSCLDWLGSEKRPWYAQIEMGRTKTGPLSGQKIPMEALADGPHDLIRWYAGNGLDPADFGDPYMAELFKKKPHLRKQEEKK